MKQLFRRNALSRDVERAPVRAPGEQRADLDLMLNDWGVHHLHISTQVEADGFVKRDEALLFVVFKPQAAYLIDIMNHGDWTRGRVLEVLATEWPEEGIIHQVPIPVGDNLTDEHRKALRKKHANALFEIGDKAFAPAGGLMASGTSIAATICTHRVPHALEVFEQKFDDDPNWLHKEWGAQGLTYPVAPEFDFAIREDGFGIIERKTGTWMNLTGWLTA